MKTLIIINDAPYGTEKAFNGLRLANQILKDNENAEVVVFLMADAVMCSLPNQKTPDGYYNIERMLKSFVQKKGKIKICTSCAEARGIDKLELTPGSTLSTMKELTQLTLESDKVITF
jgi:uncharacterized protein involved in oxidation of intracellular sulfur